MNELKDMLAKLNDTIQDVFSNKRMNYTDFLNTSGKKILKSNDYTLSADETKTYELQFSELLILNDIKIYSDSNCQVELKIAGITLFKAPFNQSISLKNYVYLSKFFSNSRIELTITDLSSASNRITTNLSYYLISENIYNNYINRV